jgi:hypothetical protein
MSLKNSSHIIGNRTRDFLACSSFPQATAPPRAYFNVTNAISGDKRYFTFT